MIDLLIGVYFPSWDAAVEFVGLPLKALAGHWT